MGLSEGKRLVLKQVALFGMSFSGTRDNPELDYDRLEFNWEKQSMEQEIEELDKLFLKIMYKIKDKYSSDAVFGLGLSGGWDSRLLLHYALEAEIKPALFIFGNRNYRNRPWINQSYKSSCQIAKLYGLKKPKVMPFHNVPDKEKYDHFCRKFPLSDHSIMRDNIHDIDYPVFDMEILGWRLGTHWGCDIPPYFPPEQFTNYILKRNSNLHQTEPMEGIITKEEMDYIKNQLKDFIKSYDGDTQMAVHNFQLSIMERPNGDNRFEIPALHPLFMKEYKTWNREWMMNRKLQSEFFRIKLPELAKIPGQRAEIPFSIKHPNKPQKLWHDYVPKIRGSFADYHQILCSNEFREFESNIMMQNDNEQFNELFDTEVAYTLPRMYWGNGGLAPTILRMKHCFDMGSIS